MNVDDLAPLIRAGYKLIPLHRWDHVDAKGNQRGKTPRDKIWVRDEYVPPDPIEWMKSGGNVGVALRDTDLVIDWDPRNLGDEPAMILRRFQEDFGINLDACPRVNTGSGGAHYYLHIPPGLRIRGDLKKLYSRAIEFKSIGRQVVAPGSIHPNGTPYMWEALAPSVEEGVPDAPAALVAAIRKPDRGGGGARSEERLSKEHVINLVDQFIPEEYRDHGAWFELMQSVHFSSGGDDEVRDFFIKWSTSDPQYEGHDEVIKARWESLDPNPTGPHIGVGTLMRHALDAGISPHPPAHTVFSVVEEDPAEEYVPMFIDRSKSGRPKGLLENTEEGMKGLGIVLTFDSFFHRYTIQDPGHLLDYFPQFTDKDWGDTATTLTRIALLRRYKLESKEKDIRDAAVANGQLRPHDALVSHIDGLARGSESMLNDWLPRFSKAPSNIYVNTVGRIFLLGAVARAYSPGVMFQVMPILEGVQGEGKSTLLRILAGPFFKEGLPHDLGREAVIAAAGNWIVEIEELETFRRFEVEALKAFITRQVDEIRWPYARTAKRCPRRFVIAGTTNEDSYLTDTTGNRRFLPLRLGRIDLGALAATRDALIAEARDTWLANPDPESLKVPPNLYAVAAAEQEARRLPDPMEQACLDYVDKIGGDPIASTVLVYEVLHKTMASASVYDMRRVGRAMRRIGWVRCKVANPTGVGRINGYRRP